MIITKQLFFYGPIFRKKRMAIHPLLSIQLSDNRAVTQPECACLI